MRLNGWQRIGIVMSVAWAIGGPIYLEHEARKDAQEVFSRTYSSCRDVLSNDPNDCFRRASEQADLVPRYTADQRANQVAAALGPVALGWLLVYALVYLMRWIRAGFTPRPK
jgi:hypothetical protein